MGQFAFGQAQPRQSQATVMPYKPSQGFDGSDAAWSAWRNGGYKQSPGTPGYQAPQSQYTYPSIPRRTAPEGYAGGTGMATSRDRRPVTGPPTGVTQGGGPSASSPAYSRPFPQPEYPPDFEGPLPGPNRPMSRQEREDDIYNQLINSGYGSSLKGNPQAERRRGSNAKDLARRLAADGVPARYFEQYGVTQPGQARPVQQPGQGTPYNPGRVIDPGFDTNRGTTPGEPQMSDGPGMPRPGPAGTDYGDINGNGRWDSGEPMYGKQPYQPPTQQPRFGQGGYGQQQDPMTQMWQQSMNAWAMPKQQLMQWGQQASQMPWGPNYGNTPDNRPSPYSVNVQGSFGNNVQDMWRNMGGFIQGVNDQAMQKPVGVYQGQGNPGAQYGKVNYDIRSLINQGNQMVQGGWQNPFMQRGFS